MTHWWCKICNQPIRGFGDYR